MTEQDALKKWCPMTRIAIGDGNYSTTNRGWVRNPSDLTNLVLSNCIGSECMMGCNEKGEWRGYCGLTNRPD